MKKLLLLVVSITVLAGCSKDSNTDPKPVSKIVGTWNSVSSQTTMSVNGKDYGQYLKDEYGLTDEYIAPFIDAMEKALTLNGSFTTLEVKSDETWHGVTDFQGTHVDVTGKWRINADQTTLTLTNNAQPGVEKSATITKLDDTDLWLDIIPSEDEIPANAFMVDGLKYKVTAKMTRKK